MSRGKLENREETFDRAAVDENEAIEAAVFESFLEQTHERKQIITR